MKKVCIFILVLCITACFFISSSCASKKKGEERITEEDTGIIDETKEEPLPVREETGEESLLTEETDRGKSDNRDSGETFKLEEVEQEQEYEQEKAKQPEIKTSYTTGPQKYLTLLPQSPADSIQPEDFIIGKLYNDEDGSEDTRFIESMISGFLGSLKENKIETSFLYEGEGSGIERFLKFHLEAKNIPQGFRIGEITLEDVDTGSVVVRLYGIKGRAEGEIYVKKKEDKWCISDIQINLNELEVPAEKSGEKFMPSSYQWILQGM